MVEEPIHASISEATVQAPLRSELSARIMTMAMSQLLRIQRCSSLDRVVNFLPVLRRSLSSALDESLIVTKACAKRIKSLQAAQGKNDMNLRVLVDAGGCSGFQYVFNMEDPNEASDEASEGDLVFSRDGAKVVVDPGSFEFIKGATIDFEQEMIRSAFAVVNNPQSESACGCGSSFALKSFEAAPAID